MAQTVKSVFKWLSLFLIGFNSIDSQESLDGYLSVSLISQFQSNGSMGDAFQLPLILEGASVDHGILLKVHFLDDLTNLNEIYYTPNPLEGEQYFYHYSYFNMATVYQFYLKKGFRFYSGWLLGHRAFFTETRKKADLFEIGIKSLISYDFSRDFGVLTSVTFSSGPGNSIQSRFFHFKGDTEVRFAPAGSIKKPYYGDILFSAGVGYETIQVNYFNQPYDKLFLYPYLAISIFY
jgi:hypothetical protein